MRFFLSLAMVGLLTLSACKINKNSSNKQPEKYFLEDVVVKPSKSAVNKEVQVMRPLVTDLIHTRLELDFDYTRQWVMGKATLYFLPYFQLPDSLHIDAKGFEWTRVSAIVAKDTIELPYRYDGQQIHLPYGKQAKCVLYLEYTAKPAELESEGGSAITDSRGLYFINPLKTDPHKPRQIWTQGETEYNSCWFPTIDAPNEKHTQDLFITVDSGEVSLSNGLLISSKKLADGRHVDHWQQLKPHAPYLTMLAIGNFKVYKESWRGKEVSYYLEPAYAPYAKTIFGKTPEMLEIYSRLTGVEYPWDKFSQIVCRDFVSGAMENTSAVLHGDFVQQDDRGILDYPQEDIIAHELFHHWFGDLVTSRSWGHLPLNESFATYGEYLYFEAALGKEEADMKFVRNLEAYLRQKSKHQESPVRIHFVHADDMFDVVSYQKGSWILHHLRSVIGDSAFFKGMKLYLSQNAYTATDIHHLRMAMEKASGVDLIPFFNRWFLSKGHPEFVVSLIQNAAGNLEVTVSQVQDSSFGLFQLKLPITLVFQNQTKQTIDLDVRQMKQVFVLPMAAQSSLATWYCDAQGEIPMKLIEQKNESMWLTQLEQAQTFSPIHRAYQHFSNSRQAIGLGKVEATKILFQKKPWYYQQRALRLLPDSLFEAFEPQVLALAQQKEHYGLAADALEVLVEKYGYAKYKEEVWKALYSPSYGMVRTAIEILYEYQADTLLGLLSSYEKLNSQEIIVTLAGIYAEQENINYNSFFAANLGRFTYGKRSIMNAYLKYLSQQGEVICKEALEVLEIYHTQSSDADKANTILNFLNQWKRKSKLEGFFEGEGFKAFYAKMEAATKI